MSLFQTHMPSGLTSLYGLQKPQNSCLFGNNQSTELFPFLPLPFHQPIAYPAGKLVLHFFSYPSTRSEES